MLKWLCTSERFPKPLFGNSRNWSEEKLRVHYKSEVRKIKKSEVRRIVENKIFKLFIFWQSRSHKHYLDNRCTFMYIYEHFPLIIIIVIIIILNVVMTKKNYSHLYRMMNYTIIPHWNECVLGKIHFQFFCFTLAFPCCRKYRLLSVLTSDTCFFDPGRDLLGQKSKSGQTLQPNARCAAWWHTSEIYVNSFYNHETIPICQCYTVDFCH